LGAVVDRSAWPVVTISVEKPADLDHLADELEQLLEAERPFALSVVAPRDIDSLQEMLWESPSARRRLRRQRARLAAWCEATAHVLDPHAFARTSPSSLRYAELIWGCATIAAGCEEEASRLLLDLLADRPLPSQLETV
jgi:hypothetical protein